MEMSQKVEGYSSAAHEQSDGVSEMVKVPIPVTSTLNEGCIQIGTISRSDYINESRSRLAASLLSKQILSYSLND